MNEKPSNILQEDEARSYCANGSDDLRPEPSGVLYARPSPSEAEGRAREACGDAINSVTPDFERAFAQIAAPERRRIQGLRCHPLQEEGLGKRFPFDVAENLRAGCGQLESKVKSADPAEERENADWRDGGMIHTQRLWMPMIWMPNRSTDRDSV